MVELLEKEPIKHRTMIKLFLYTGIRRGELAGLEWGDIDWDKNMITIQRSSQYISVKGIITKETKTTTSDRSIRLPNMVFDMLKKYRSLRHTNITLMIMAGVPLRTVARRAGHASTATTSVIYSHAIQSADELASEVLDDLLKPQVSGKRQVG